MLQRRAEDAAEHSNEEQPHHDARERAAEMKSPVEKNDWQGQKPEPEMAAHPGLRAADPPRGDAFARAKERGKNHEAETGDAENQADGAATTRSLGRFECVEDVHNRRNREDCQR